MLDGQEPSCDMCGMGISVSDRRLIGPNPPQLAASLRPHRLCNKLCNPQTRNAGFKTDAATRLAQTLSAQNPMLVRRDRRRGIRYVGRRQTLKYGCTIRLCRYLYCSYRLVTEKPDKQTQQKKATLQRCVFLNFDGSFARDDARTCTL